MHPLFYLHAACTGRNTSVDLLRPPPDISIGTVAKEMNSSHDQRDNQAQDNTDQDSPHALIVARSEADCKRQSPCWSS